LVVAGLPSRLLPGAVSSEDEPALELGLPEELVVLSHHVGSGKPAGKRITSGVAGAELVELVLAQRIRLRRRRTFGLRTTLVEAVDATATGDRTLDELLEKIASGKRPKPARSWVVQRRTALPVYRDRLLESGVLVLDEVDAGWARRKRKRYRPRSAARASKSKSQVRTTLLHRTPMDPRAVALAVLAYASGLTDQIVEPANRKAARGAGKKLPETFKDLAPVLREAGEVPSEQEELADSLAEFGDGIGDLADVIEAVGDAGGDGDGSAD
jgi:hypothetical protein